MRIITFKIDEELLRELDWMAEEMGLNRSQLIREAIIQRLSQLRRERMKRRIVVIG